MYHVRDGLYFDRLADGSVKVRFQTVNGADFDVVIPADQWASVIASVSARGESAETWNEARQYHNRR